MENNYTDITHNHIDTNSNTSSYVNPLNSKFNKYVIDTSVSGNDTIFRDLNNLCENGKTIYITTTTLDELSRLATNSRDLQSSSSVRSILKLATIIHPNSFEIIDTAEYEGVSKHITTSIGICDSRILQFCYEMKNEVMLLTADRAMSLYARSLKINVMCLETRTTFIKSKNTYFSNRPTITQPSTSPDHPSMHVVRQNGNLIIQTPQNHQAGIGIRVILPSKVELNYGPIRLYCGYVIMIARRDAKNNIIFNVYNVVSLGEAKGEYKLVYTNFYKYYYTYFDTNGNLTYERFLNEFRLAYLS